jgi:hypothetical protein
MFKRNPRQLQPTLINSISELPDKYRERLDESWAGAFRRECFGRIREDAFAVLFSDVDSRPNTPVNILVGLDVIKAGFGWSDEELYNHFLFDLQVRHALGLDTLAEGDFDLRTLYNFRRRLAQYHLAHGVNLLTEAFADITDQQITTFKVQTNIQRMDSVQLASNIMDMSRLQLLVEAVQRLHRLLSPADQSRYAELLAPYVESNSRQYVYHVKGKEATHERIAQLGPILARLLSELQSSYGQTPTFQALERLFGENYHLEAAGPRLKANSEISAGCLQSLDDLEATYRKKGNRAYKGYVANVTETCHPENELQIITKVQVAPNNTDDAQMLVEALPDLKRRTDLDTIHTDGAFTGPEADQALHAHGVTQIPTAIRGTQPDTEKLHLSDFVIEQDAQGAPTQVTCPQGQQASVSPVGKAHSFVAHFATEICETCPYARDGRCPTEVGKRRRYFRLSFDQPQLDRAQRRRRCATAKQALKNLRVAVEATVRSVKHPFPAGKLPVRGRFRITCMVIGSAAMTNVRRIQRYLARKLTLQPVCQGCA